MRRRRRDAEAEPASEQAPTRPERGPYDIEDIDHDAQYLDLGSLMLMPPPEGLDLRLQVEESTGDVAALLLVGEDGLIEMRAFASSRSGDLWQDAREAIAADTTRRGGSVNEQEGPFGPELFCQVPVPGEDGQQVVQPSRVIGFSGPRWFLRATIAGRPAVDSAAAQPFEQVFATTVVNRGADAMPPGEALPLKLPPEARRVD